MGAAPAHREPATELAIVSEEVAEIERHRGQAPGHCFELLGEKEGRLDRGLRHQRDTLEHGLDRFGETDDGADEVPQSLLHGLPRRGVAHLGDDPQALLVALDAARHERCDLE